jgi:hypothetical protein
MLWKLLFITTWDDSQNRSHPTDSAEEALKLLAAKQEYAHFDGLNKAEKKRQALQAAATSVNFFDAGIGATLLAAEVTFEGDALTVINPATGEARINAQGEAMSVAELAREKSNQHPYMIRSTFRPGAGSTMQANRPVEEFPLEDYFGKAAFGPLAHKLSKSDPIKYSAMRRAAVAKGLLPG